MEERNIIPLTSMVTVDEGGIGGLLERIKTEGVRIPRTDNRPRLGIDGLLSIANNPVGLSTKQYIASAGSIYRGKVLKAEEREAAYSVRKQFFDFLIEPPKEDSV